VERFINDQYQEKIRNDYTCLVRTIRTTLNNTGLAVLEDFIHPDFLAELQSSVDRLTPLCYVDGKRKSLIGYELENTVFYEVAFSGFVVQLANDILEPCNVSVDRSDIHPVLNILIGEHAQDTAKSLHFDATYLTMAMPVVMPSPNGDRDGKFRIWPNFRKFSQSPWRNRFYWWIAKIGLIRRMAKNLAINFLPGNLYFFYGFRSYHGTEDLDPKSLRANCLINFGGPFFDLQKGKVVRYPK